MDLQFLGLRIVLFRSLQLGNNSSFCGSSGLFLETSASEKQLSDSGWKMAIPYATNPYPHQVPADSYRAMLVAIASRSSFMWCRTAMPRTARGRMNRRTDMAVYMHEPEGGIAPLFWGSAKPTQKISRDMGYSKQTPTHMLHSSHLLASGS